MWLVEAVCDRSVLLWLQASFSASPAQNKDSGKLLKLVLSAAGKLFLDNKDGAPQEFLVNFYTELRKLWTCHRLNLRKGKRKHLAEILARIGMEFDDLPCMKELKMNKPALFNLDKHFLEKHWESSPAIIKGTQSFTEVFLEEFPVHDLQKLLKSLLSSAGCPPACNDELDMKRVFDEMKESLGEAMKYQQDIRLVKSSGETEVLYQTDASEQVVRVEDCLKAFELGFTIAIRGMEFRSPVVAAISESLKLQLGQASVGANLYLTPPNAQGFSIHYDDHCVFAVQIAGEKSWGIYPPQNLLPRLYEKRFPPEVAGETGVDLLLPEGSVLYIPRGFPHRAMTSNRKRKRGDLEKLSFDCCCWFPEHFTSSKLDGFSLHLTFGVEVEAPFAWEGFMHIALHNWFLEGEKMQKLENRACKLILHYSIRAVGDQRGEFRKACLNAMPGDESGSETFRRLVGVLDSEIDSEQGLQRIIEKDESLDWLRHLPSRDSFRSFFEEIDMTSGLLKGSSNQEFTRNGVATIKDDFVRQVLNDNRVYSGAGLEFEKLLESYSRCRKRTMNAMLALRCNLQQLRV